jgi:hypothetical protein
MAFCSVKGAPVLDGRIVVPRVGAWHADVTFDLATSTPANPANLVLGGQTFLGSFQRVGFDRAGRAVARIVGGAGGLGTILTPKSYRAVPLRLPLNDALTAGKEKLSTTADPAVTSFTLTNWSSMQGSVGAQLALLVRAVSGATWRVLPDGTVWLGFESWPTSTLPDSVPISTDPEQQRITIASDAPAVLPGTIFQGSKISRVEHSIAPWGVRTTLYTET